MNGIEKAAIQRVLGTRAVIDDIDHLRILCGCSSVQVLTPIVEIKLRSGNIPLKSLHIRLDLNDIIMQRRANVDASHDVGDEMIGDDSHDIACKKWNHIYLDIIYAIKHNNVIINMKLDWINMKYVMMLQEVLDKYCKHVNNKIDEEQYSNVNKDYNLTKTSTSDGYHLSNNNCYGCFRHNGMELMSIICVVKYIIQTIMDVDHSLVDIEVNHKNDNCHHDIELDDCQKRNNSVIDDDDYEDDDDLCVSNDQASDFIYTCKRCNEVLFVYNDLHEHSLSNTHQSSCTSYYLEDYPVWIAAASQLPPSPPSSSSSSLIGHQELSRHFNLPSVVESNLKDKIYCFKCKSRLGSYSWSGSQCSCLEWVVPSFQFIKSKIDCRIVIVNK